MKHSFKITTILLVIFLLAQFIGIGVLYNSIDVDKSAEEGKIVFEELPIGERPPLNEGTSYIGIVIAILIGTGILLLLIKYKLTIIWRFWFLIAVTFALFVAISSVMRKEIALIVALFFGAWKIFKPNVWVQNITELFIYGGLAVVFVPLLNLFSAVVLLFLISAYDAYAVWKSKHMIKLAKSQTDAKVFAGLLIPYKLGKKVKKGKEAKKKSVTKKVKVRSAILGGGDIGFPLIFAGVILKEMGLWQSLIIPVFAAIGLGLLFWKANEKKFYPAMPFISAGCLIGLGVVWLIGLV